MVNSFLFAFQRLRHATWNTFRFPVTQVCIRNFVSLIRRVLRYYSARTSEKLVSVSKLENQLATWLMPTTINKTSTRVTLRNLHTYR